ncbi:MAG: threonine--tRNA ligase [Patescibacteria group bacterium]|nr:threonine--tRNA ligase [Patescibacteria group bacterium]MDE2438064.1 threonine--tRNA ligase [Patescibacteria group bacterium]
MVPKKVQTPSLDYIRHSLAHLLAAAVLKKFPDAKLGVGPTIEDGFYYDFLLPQSLTADDLKEFESTMRSMIASAAPFKAEKVTPEEARTRFKKQPFKKELIKEFAKEGKQLTIEHTGNFFSDLCRGGHVKNTREIDPQSFALVKIGGAYWKSDATKPQLQRIYGLAFATKKELDEYRTMLQEAERRDHKKLGPQLDLFVFSELVGGGLPLFTPRGTVIREELEAFVQSLQIPMGYERVRIPHITKKELYETSGHWQKFKDELFKITSREGHEFALKPMNCPHHTQIYASRARSYRELPLRYSEVTAVYRDEQSGELGGLSRVRMITQDDAHIFCRILHIEEEVMKVWDIIDTFYAVFNMPLTVRFSRHDPAHFEKYLGTPTIWKKAETQLKSAIKKRGVAYIDGLGEAAMYGPKIDFIAKDSLGRDWQLATIQLDFNLPERFALSCVNEKGKDERIVMVHRAILGSVERFMAVLIEHYAGAFPTWLAPVQVALLPVGERHNDYAHTVAHTLKDAGVRVVIEDDNETLGKRIRESEQKKIPYILVLGDKEVEANTVSVRKHGKGDKGALALDAFTISLLEEIKNRT